MLKRALQWEQFPQHDLDNFKIDGWLLPPKKDFFHSPMTQDLALSDRFSNSSFLASQFLYSNGHNRSHPRIWIMVSLVRARSSVTEKTMCG